MSSNIGNRNNNNMVVVGNYSFDPHHDLLGRGSFADVYRGSSEEGFLVAIKRIHKSRLTKPNNKKLLESEVTILREIRHQNVVALYDSIETDEYICLIMEYCDGGDLASYIASNSPLPESVIGTFLVQIVDAIQYLRSKDIIHRDLKPQNILLCSLASSPQLKIADFGFARYLSQDMAATFCGSPLYMAPEVLDGDVYGAKADLWSVGAIAYQCLTSHAPYQAPSIKALLAMLKNPNTPSPAFPTNVSPDLEDLIRSLLCIDVKSRIGFEELARHPFLSRFKAKPYFDGHLNVPGLGLESSSLSSSVNLDDKSYVILDRQQIEVDALADDLTQRMTRPPTTLASSSSSSLLALSVAEAPRLVAQLNEILKPANAVMSVARDRHLVSSLPASPFLLNAQNLLIYNKALGIFRQGLSRLGPLLQGTHRSLPTPALVDAVQGFRRKFNECIERVDQSRRALLESVEKAPLLASAEELIYDYAIELCRMAATDESLHNIERSEVIYSKALVLLNVLLVDAQHEDFSVLKNLIDMINRRLEAVAVQSKARVQHDAEANVQWSPLETLQYAMSKISPFGSGEPLMSNSPQTTLHMTPAFPQYPPVQLAPYPGLSTAPVYPTQPIVIPQTENAGQCTRSCPSCNTPCSSKFCTRCGSESVPFFLPQSPNINHEYYPQHYRLNGPSSLEYGEAGFQPSYSSHTLF